MVYYKQYNVHYLNKNQVKILEDAYVNDFVDNIDYSEKRLDSLLEKGYLMNKHKTPAGVYVYWISEQGISLLKSLGKTFQ